MNPIKIRIRNYRNIPFNNPIEFEVGEGITIITGVNNVGKSNLLKLFYEFRNSINHQNQIIQGNVGFSFGGKYSNLLNQDSSSIDQKIQIIAEIDSYQMVLEIMPVEPEGGLEATSYFQQLFQPVEAKSSEIENIGKLFYDSMYIGSFRTPSFQTSGNYFDIQIGNHFISLWDSWANGSTLDTKKQIRLLKEELKDLFGFHHFDIYPNQGNQSMIVETDNGIFNLDELGSGISHVILVLANAMIKRPSYILIDEPETGLHPKMQEIFLRALLSKAKVGIIATSHSIGLARSVGADRIYIMNLGRGNKVHLSLFGEKFPISVREAISELGYSQFVELGGNNILLVQGRTDIKAFREILNLYGIEHHFIIMDLGGSSMINGRCYDEISELKRLNAKSYSVIFDSEFSKESDTLKNDFLDFKSICESLGFQVFTTEGHSTENYISQEAITAVVGKSCMKLALYENMQSSERKTAGTNWDKNKNWLMFKKMTRQDFAGTKLDKFIVEELIPLVSTNITKKRVIAEEASH